MLTNQVNRVWSEDYQAIYHVFYTILQMDKASYIKLFHWLSYYGINSIEEMVMCYSAHDPIYEVNGNTHYLDSWISENVSSICTFAIRNDYMENHQWLSIKSISVFEKQGFKFHIPPPAPVKTVSPPSVSQVQPKGRPQPIAINIATVSRSATIPSSSQVTTISTRDPVKAIKNTMEISVPVISTPQVSISSSLPTLGHTIPDPPMMNAAREVPKPLPNLLTSSANTTIISQDTLPLDPFPPSTNG
jgi:hypothetical protein